MSEIRTVKQGHLTFWYGIEQGTQEWLDFRSKYCTCSNASLLCDKGAKAAREANRQHAARITPNATIYTERGHELEAEVKELLGQHFNNETHTLINCSFITNDLYPLGGYSPDGIITEAKTGKFVAPVEVKCFNDWTWRYDQKKSHNVKHWSWKHKKCCENLESNIGSEYIAQFEMEMLMTNTSQLLVVLYNPDATEDVPKLKIHIYHPFEVVDEDGNKQYPYQEKLKEALQGDRVLSSESIKQIKEWQGKAIMPTPEWS